MNHYKSLKYTVDAIHTHPPNWIFFLRIKMEVLLAKLQRWHSLEVQVCPAFDEFDNRLKGVESQAVIAIVAEVCHEDTDLW